MTPKRADTEAAGQPPTPNATAPPTRPPRSTRLTALTIALVAILTITATMQSVRLTHTERDLAEARQEVTQLRNALEEGTNDVERLHREAALLRNQLDDLDTLLRQRQRELNDTRAALTHATTDTSEALPPELIDSIEPPERPTGISINDPPPHETTPQPKQPTRDGED